MRIHFQLIIGFLGLSISSMANILTFPENLNEWKLSEGPFIITIENLYEYAGNDYDTFFEYGFVHGSKASYINAQKDIIEVSVFEFVNPIKSLGLFSFFKEDIYIDKKMPCESIFIAHYGSFQKGKYVVNVIGDSQSEKFEKSIAAFAQSFNKIIPGDCTKPDWFDFDAYENNPGLRENYRLFFGNIVLKNYYEGDPVFIPNFKEGIYFPIDRSQAFIFKCQHIDQAKYFYDKIKTTPKIVEKPGYKKWFNTITIENYNGKTIKLKRKDDCIILLIVSSPTVNHSKKLLRKISKYKI